MLPLQKPNEVGKALLVPDAATPANSSSVYTRYLSQFYKTKLCKYHVEGYCNRGDNCTHAHSVSELESQPNLSRARMCRILLQKGHCDDVDCAYAHDLDTVKSANAFFRTKLCDFAKKGHCKLGDKCRYAHCESELIRDDSGFDDTGNYGLQKAHTVDTLDEPTRDRKLAAIHGRQRRKRRGRMNKAHTAPLIDSPKMDGNTLGPPPPTSGASTPCMMYMVPVPMSLPQDSARHFSDHHHLTSDARNSSRNVCTADKSRSGLMFGGAYELINNSTWSSSSPVVVKDDKH
ncbi:hypothetical protein FOL47_001697 [Perkinsus chesapeaki]|uniref:C3H1-type domain-containing protein n=1 Tax=Perkinsus chesapeaki TaxID=330153 RepID=A0A7J6MI54_PERCH|nr:hypothetical protein FOL47_001697 [Perkinsus chesapeaki]